jgi:hypothetical protein
MSKEKTPGYQLTPYRRRKRFALFPENYGFASPSGFIPVNRPQRITPDALPQVSNELAFHEIPAGPSRRIKPVHYLESGFRRPILFAHRDGDRLGMLADRGPQPFVCRGGQCALNEPRIIGAPLSTTSIVKT